ncbi:isochorismatase family protein [Streptomyces sp. NBC_01618]|uniref:isochorismatase family protein n=1 Tax=Streptomyces sp. NBC_01618 TaxID=2975900 RepID=UPI003863E712|nr:isochorismatase family protein [Streptomyces sp. NBC_01618]
MSAYRRVWENLRDGDRVAHMGLGRRPALVVVDLEVGFTDPEEPLGFDLTSEIAATNRLLGPARDVGAPVIFFTVAYESDSTEADIWLEKIPGGRALVTGTPAVEIDPRLERKPGDPVMVKAHASCFVGTDLASYLRGAGVDTVVITGATTSGCVRTTAVDACSHGFRTVVVEDASGDRSPMQHLASLIDIHIKYGEVLNSDAASRYLRSCS